MPSRRGITDWFPTSGEARGLVEVKGRVGGKGGRMRRRKFRRFGPKKKTFWVPWMLSSTYGVDYNAELIPANHQTVAQLAFNPFYADESASRSGMFENDVVVRKVEGCVWCVVPVYDTTAENATVNEPMQWLVNWYWHKGTKEPVDGTSSEDSSKWNPLSQEGSGYPLEGDAVMMRRDINKWGQGWTGARRNFFLWTVGQNGYTVPAAVAGDQASYNVPAMTEDLLYNPLGAFEIMPLRIPGPRLPLKFNKGEMLFLRATAQRPLSVSDNLLLGTDGASTTRPLIFPNMRFLCER